MANLVPPHGGATLKPLLLDGQPLADEKKKAETLKKIRNSVWPIAVN